MAVRYRPISFVAFKTAMDKIGFASIQLPNTWEHVWERAIDCKLSHRYTVRIYSSVDMDTGITRDMGTDAIHVQVFDTVRNRPVVDYRVHRTENAITNLIERAREAYGYVSQHPEHHCSCGNGLMVARGKPERRFLGCTAYPACKETRNIRKAV